MCKLEWYHADGSIETNMVTIERHLETGRKMINQYLVGDGEAKLTPGARFARTRSTR